MPDTRLSWNPYLAAADRVVPRPGLNGSALQSPLTRPALVTEPSEVAAPVLNGRRRKISTTIRLDSDVLAWLREPGPGYQSRINALLRREMLRARKV